MLSFRHKADYTGWVIALVMDVEVSDSNVMLKTESMSSLFSRVLSTEGTLLKLPAMGNIIQNMHRRRRMNINKS